MKIKDIGVITALRVLGIRETSIDQSDPREIWYLYEDTANVSEGVEKYYADKLLISAMAVIETLKRVKSQLYYIKDKTRMYK